MAARSSCAFFLGCERNRWLLLSQVQGGRQASLSQLKMGFLFVQGETRFPVAGGGSSLGCVSSVLNKYRVYVFGLWICLGHEHGKRRGRCLQSVHCVKSISWTSAVF